jgi:hypothetical protein
MQQQQPPPTTTTTTTTTTTPAPAKSARFNVDIDDSDPFATPKSLSSGITVDNQTSNTMDSENTVTNKVNSSGFADADFETSASHAIATDTSEELGSLAGESAIMDENPISDIITVGLGIASIFTGIFEHPKAETPAHAMNPSSQFGQAE